MVIEPRTAWNARDPRDVLPRPLSHFKGVRVHHSGGSASASVRAIQDWDMDHKNLWDIGYSYAIRDGRVFEGRGTNHPAHDSINDTFGVCIIGTYTTSLPSRADLDALVACIRELRAMTGRALPVDGHRDAAGAATVCPGHALHQHLPTIRARADQEEDDMPTADEIADAVLERILNKVDETSGSTPRMRVKNMLRFTHFSATEARVRQNPQILSELAAVRAELEALPEALGQVADLTDEQVRVIADRIAAAGSGAADEVLARALAAAEAFLDDDDSGA